MSSSKSGDPGSIPDRICVLDLEVSPDPNAAILLNSRKPIRESSWAVSRIDVASVLVAERRGRKWTVEDLLTIVVSEGDVFHVAQLPTEEDLLQELVRHIRPRQSERSQDARLVTYNGEAFDLPIIRRRAMAHGLFDKPSLLTARSLGSFDVMRNLAGGSGARHPKLKEAAAAFGIPATHQVQRGPRLHYDPRAAKCETDVCATFLLYAYELAAQCGDGEVITTLWRALADHIGYDRMVPGHLAQFARHPRLRSMP